MTSYKLHNLTNRQVKSIEYNLMQTDLLVGDNDELFYNIFGDDVLQLVETVLNLAVEEKEREFPMAYIDAARVVNTLC